MVFSAPVRAQRAWVQDWVRDYASGQYAEVAGRLKTVVNLRPLEDDLEKVSKTWLKTEPVDQRRRELGAFALEAALAHADQGASAGRLVEWGCRQIRRVTKPGEFEHRWHLAAFAALAGAVDPDSLQAHVVHMRFHFPNEPRLVFERAVATELSTADFFTEGKASAAELRERTTEAAKRYREATASPDAGVRAEAWLRLGRVESELGNSDAALVDLDQAAALTTDPALRYLLALFRGRALERLGQPDAARQAYRAALDLAPGAHAATISLAALLFRQGERLEADRLIRALLGNPPAADPWLLYWPADYRHAATLVQAMREALK